MAKRTSGELKRLAREFLNGNYTITALAALAATLLPSFVLAPFSAGLTEEFNFAAAAYGLASVIIGILGQLLAAGIVRIHILLAQKQPITLIDLFWVFRNRPDRFILGTVLLFGIMLVSAAPAAVCIVYLYEAKPALSIYVYLLLGLAAIVLLAAELFVYCMYSLIYPLYIEHPEMTVLDGFRTSRTIMHGNKAKLFLLKLSFIGWLLLGACSIGIGFLWIQPYISQTTANFYLDLTGWFDNGQNQTDHHADFFV